MIMHEALRSLLLPKVLHRIGPKNVAHETRRWWLTEPIQLRKARELWVITANIVETTYVPNVVQGVKLGGKSSMDAEELLVHDGSEGKCAERIHAGIVHTLGILALTYM